MNPNNSVSQIMPLKSFRGWTIVASPRKFFIKYKKKSGEIAEYRATILETFSDGSFTGYCYKKGIRRFREEGILDMQIDG